MPDTVADHRSFYLVFELVSKELARMQSKIGMCTLNFEKPFKVSAKHDSGGKVYRRETIITQLLGTDRDVCP